MTTNENLYQTKLVRNLCFASFALCSTENPYQTVLKFM